MQQLKRKNETGFTLIELLVVVIIVAILVAVGIPLLQGNVARAKLTEADAGLGTIRTVMRAYFAEHGNYTLAVNPLTSAGATNFSNIGIRLRVGVSPAGSPGDLDGRFFSQEAYLINVTTPTTFCATANGANSVNTGLFTTRFNEVNGVAGVTLLQRSMDELGNIYNNDTNCTLGNRIN